MIRLAYLVTHPIPYQAPLLRRIAREPGIKLHVFFRSDMGVREYYDPAHARNIAWDVPLLEGYSSEFLPSKQGGTASTTLGMRNYGLKERLVRTRFDVLWIHGYSLPYHLGAMLLAKKRGMKVMIRDEATAISAPRGPLKVVFKRAWFSALNHFVDRFLAIGTLNANYYVEQGIDPANVFTVPYAVDNNFFQSRANEALRDSESLRQNLRLDPNRPVILFIARLVARKRCGDLVQALRLIHTQTELRPYLLIVGDGPERSEIETQIARTGPIGESIRIVGFKGQQELPAFHILSDVFALPSQFEPWGLVINEAMNCGRPIIASDQVGSAADLIVDGENGYTFPVGNIPALAQRLTSVLSDRYTSKRMGAASLDRVNKWSFEEDIRGLKAAIKDL